MARIVPFHQFAGGNRAAQLLNCDYLVDGRLFRFFKRSCLLGSVSNPTTQIASSSLTLQQAESNAYSSSLYDFEDQVPACPGAPQALGYPLVCAASDRSASAALTDLPLM